MRRSTDDDLSPGADQSNDWGVAVAIALSIVICLVAFVWIFVELEPFMSDFTGTDVIVTPDPTDPIASPVEATETNEMIDSP